MTFFSINFAAFVLVTLALYWLTYKWQPVRVTVLILASYFFYSQANPYFLLLLLFVSVFDFMLSKRMARASTPGRRKALLIVSLVIDLGLLASFKYLNFFANIPIDIAGLFGVYMEPSQLRLLLPVGISFYIFQTLSYSIDVYRGRTEPAHNLLDHLLYMAFFPRLLVGPIVRAEQFLPQLKQTSRLTKERFGKAVFLIISGLFKKMIFAEYLALNLVDRVFDLPLMFSSTEVLLGIFACVIHLYADFSGYTDIALGLGHLFGLDLPENFNFPFKARNLRDFWRRWHITLSRWLTDYLYISMGGSRVNRQWKIYRNLMITMLLGGLWHGAAWTFVVWGLLHGVGLMFTRIWQRWLKKKGKDLSKSEPARIVAVFFTFLYLALTWIFYRIESMQTFFDMMSSVFRGVWEAPNLNMDVVYVMGVAFFFTWWPDKWYNWVRKTWLRLPWFAQTALFAGAMYLLFHFASSEVQPFVYEKF